LVCEYVDGRWVADGQVLGGAPVQVPTGEALAVRLRADDVALHPAGADPAPDRTTASVTVVDAEYAGRHMDVVVVMGATRLQARIPTGDTGSWSRRVAPGDRLVASFRPADAMLYVADADQTADAEAIGEPMSVSDLARAETVEV
jgi:hypothetical protein